MPRTSHLAPCTEGSITSDSEPRTELPRLSRTEALASFRKRLPRSILPAVLLVPTLVVIALLTDDYGIGTDESNNALVGAEGLKAYTSSAACHSFLELDYLGHHGPSYFMVFSAASAGMTQLIPAWQAADGRHFANFLTLLLAGASLYFLCLRLLPSGVALATAAVFLTQPLLFGHGFINQKDVPFMSFFLTTLVAGLAGVDRLVLAMRDGPSQQAEATEARQALRDDLRTGSWAWKAAFAVWGVGFLWLILDLLIFDQMLDLVKSLISLAHAGQAWEPINRLYGIIAEDAYKTRVQVYHAKVDFVYWLLGRVVLAALGVALGFFLGRKAIPRTRRVFLPGPVGAYVVLLAAAGLLGFTVSIRPLGGLAGLLVSGYIVHRLRWKSLGPLLVFWASAAAVTYMTWPWLWPAPLERLAKSLQYLSDFDEQKLVLFRGQLFPSEAMPWDYLPVLLAIQLTEPVILLFLLGLGLAVVDAMQRPERRAVVLIVLVWFGVVTLLYMLPGSVHYNNFRHVLFMLPALFLIFGYGVALLFRLFRPAWLRALVVAILILPGALGISRLHPYEYIYYNGTVGGVQGAQGRFELDYWCTSYREAMDYVNLRAPAEAKIAVGPPVSAAREFARTDLDVANPLSLDNPAFTLVCDLRRGSAGVNLSLPVVHRISIAGVGLAEVRQGNTASPGESMP